MVKLLVDRFIWCGLMFVVIMKTMLRMLYGMCVLKLNHLFDVCLVTWNTIGSGKFIVLLGAESIGIVFLMLLLMWNLILLKNLIEKVICNCGLGSDSDSDENCLFMSVENFGLSFTCCSLLIFSRRWFGFILIWVWLCVFYDIRLLDDLQLV